MSISVIVPTKNEARNLPHLLASLPAEIQLVVCDASTDGTASVAVAQRPDRTLVVDAPGTVAEARQRGALASSGNILVFTDADVEFDAGSFDRLQLLEEWDGVCGAKLSRDLYARDYQLMLRAQAVTYRCLGIAAASGSNMVMTRPAFDAVGGFRTQLSCNEDTELFMRAGRRGLRMLFDERLVVWARDHRRLRRGRGVKAMHLGSHSGARNAMKRTRRVAIFTETFLPRVDGIVNTLRWTLRGLLELGWEPLVVAPAGNTQTMPGVRVIGSPSIAFPPYPEVRLAYPTPDVWRSLDAFGPAGRARPHLATPGGVAGNALLHRD